MYVYMNMYIYVWGIMGLSGSPSNVRICFGSKKPWLKYAHNLMDLQIVIHCKPTPVIAIAPQTLSAKNIIWERSPAGTSKICVKHINDVYIIPNERILDKANNVYKQSTFLYVYMGLIYVQLRLIHVIWYWIWPHQKRWRLVVQNLPERNSSSMQPYIFPWVN